MRRQGSGEPPISLFSFQDIITSLTGVLFLVMILLALFLCETQTSSPGREAAEAVRQRSQELAAELSAARQRLAAIIQQLEALGGLTKLQRMEQLERLRSEEKRFALEEQEENRKIRETTLRLEEKRQLQKREENRRRSLNQQLMQTRKRLQKLEQLQKNTRQKMELAETIQRFQLSSTDQATPVFLLLKEHDAELTDPVSGEKRLFSHRDDPHFAALKSDLAARVTAGRYLLFFVRPAAFPYFSKLLAECQSAGIRNYGAEVLPDDRVEIKIVTEAAP